LGRLLKAATAKRKQKNGVGATSGLSTPATGGATPMDASPALAVKTVGEQLVTVNADDQVNDQVTDKAQPATKPRATRSTGSADTRRSTRSNASNPTKPEKSAAAESVTKKTNNAKQPVSITEEPKGPVEESKSAAPFSQKDAPDMIPVTCGAKRGEYIISEKKVLFEGSKIAPAKFEELAQLKSKRWKRNIKVVGEVSDRAVAIGEMLDILGIDTAAGVEAPKHKPRRTPGKK
jgi:hypothetical protein